MLHELLHAEMYSWVSEQYPDLWDWDKTSNYTDNTDYWNNVININLPGYVGNTNHHNIMQAMLDKITTSLWELNGKIGTPDDYLYWAHITMNSVKFGFLTTTELLSMKNIFNNNVLIPNNNENNFGCN